MRRHRSRIETKTAEQIGLMREAGLVVARALGAMTEAAVPGVSSADLDVVAREELARAGATSSFLGYDLGHGPFPGVICASVNDRIVHGVPSAAEILRDGDLISIDFGAIVDGWHADAAVTVAVGSVRPEAHALSDATRAAMWDGVAAARAGGRVGDISSAVESSVEAAGEYGIVEGYGGHGIGSAMHMDPHILNYGRPGEGERLRVRQAVAIEPMLTLGSPATRELADGWTVVTVDGSVAAHWEHTVALLDDGIWVLTAMDGGSCELGARGVTVSARAA